MRGLARIARESKDFEGLSVALHLPVGAASPASWHRTSRGAWRESRGPSLLNNIFALVQALLNYVLSLTGGVLPISI
jgi:hypothetical protein